MKLSSIILEVKKVPFGTNTVEVPIPKDLDPLELKNLSFYEQEVDFKLNKQGRAIPTYKHRLAGAKSPKDTSLLHYMKRWRDTILIDQNSVTKKGVESSKKAKLDASKKPKPKQELQRQADFITKFLDEYRPYLKGVFSEEWFELRDSSDPTFKHLEDTNRINAVKNFIDDNKGFRTSITSSKLSKEDHVTLLLRPIPRLLDDLKNSVDPADALVSPTKRDELTDQDKEDAKSQRFLRTHKFEVKFNSDTLKKRQGLYMWLINGEIQYVGLTTNFKDRPGSNYDSPDAWNSAFGTTGNRLNAYISQKLERLKDPKDVNKVIRVFCATIPMSEVEGFEEEFEAQKKGGNGNIDNYYKQTYLTPYESAVKRWSQNLDSGKVDSTLHKPKPGRGSYGKSGNLNKADIT